MIKIDYQICDLCGTCISVCPVDCMILDEIRLYINEKTCTECELCIRVCPFGALSKTSQKESRNED